MSVRVDVRRVHDHRAGDGRHLRDPGQRPHAHLYDDRRVQLRARRNREQRPFDRELLANGSGASVDPTLRSDSHASIMNALSLAIDPKLGTGTRWLRRNRPTSPSTPPFSCAPSIPGVVKIESNR